MSKKSPAFTDAAIRQKAMEARRAKPKGKHNTRYEDVEDLPLGVWSENATHNTLGRPIGRESKERMVQRERAHARMEDMVDAIFDAAAEIVKGPSAGLRPEEVQAWSSAAKARAMIVNKVLDKLLPDLRTDPKGGGARKVTQILIGGPLQSAMSGALTNGTAIAAQYTEVPNNE